MFECGFLAAFERTGIFWLIQPPYYLISYYGASTLHDALADGASCSAYQLTVASRLEDSRA